MAVSGEAIGEEVAHLAGKARGKPLFEVLPVGRRHGLRHARQIESQPQGFLSQCGGDGRLAHIRHRTYYMSITRLIASRTN